MSEGNNCSGSGEPQNAIAVPKSSSSSSGVNEISISASSNSSLEDQHFARMRELAEKEKSGEIPGFKDIVDLLKFSYILQKTDLKSGDLNAVPKGAHELWSELKESLVKRPILQGCYNRRQTVCNCCAENAPAASADAHTSKPVKPNENNKDNLSRVHHVAKRDMASRLCSVDEALGQGLDEVIRQGLLDPLVPFLTSSSAAVSCANNNNNSSAVNSSNPALPLVSGGGHQRSLLTSTNLTHSAAESSSKEDEAVGLLSRANSSTSLVAMPVSHKMTSDGLMRRSTSASALNSRKKVDPSLISLKKESKKKREVVIHVCDESRDAKKDFTCPQDLLLSHMGYFRDITSGQSLEDVDISVHCDVTIFEWLMDWLRAQNKAEDDDEEEEMDEDQAEPVKPRREEPELSANNVVSILVSASFLKMGPLVDYALIFLHQNMNKVLVTTHNLNCLGDPLLTRLSHLYKPTEVEDLMDRRDRIHSRLYTKLICSLCEPMPQPDREIFATAATLFRCKLCGLHLTQQLARLLPCHPLRSVINRRGEVVPKHQRDPNFNLNDFLRSLRVELKSWRKVFWRLWGICHALYCSLCSSHFPAYLHEFCSFHPQDPDFPGIPFKNSTQPFGTFLCCQMPIYRFQPLPANHKGCQARDHRVKIRSETDTKIYKVLMANRDLICLCPARKSTIKIAADISSITLPKSLDKEPWNLSGDLMVSEISLIPLRKRRGLVNRTLWETLRTSVIQGVLKKSVHSLFSAVQAARGIQSQASSHHDHQSPDTSKAARILYGRLKRAPKLPVKPALQSSESSTDDLSGSEESSSSGLEDHEQATNKEEPSKVSILGNGGNGTEDDENDLADPTLPVVAADPKLKGNNSKTTGDLCIEIKLGKDKDKSKTLLATAFQSALSGMARGPSAASGSTGSRSGSTEPSNWARWDGERSIRANQDYQREREEMAMRDLMRYLARRQQHMARQKGQAPPTVSTYLRPVASAPNLTACLGPPFGGSFLRLEQDWRETHMAYLQHRTSTAAHQNNSLGIAASRLPRPGSAASLRSARYSRVNRH